MSKKPSKTSVFDFHGVAGAGYKSYLLQWIGSRESGGRGERSRIAAALRCQLAYISQVLGGSAHLSFEQAEALNDYLDHTESEADFFILLVHLDKAGSVALRKRIQTRIQAILQNRLMLKHRLKFEKTLTREDQMTYYSSWYFSAIHMALSVPALQTRDSLARAFQLPVSKVSGVLDFLVSRGFAKEVKGGFQASGERIHLGNESNMISRHHSNWRMQAIRSLEAPDQQALHYSSVACFSEEDLPKVREALVKAIESVREIIVPSKNEAVFCYSLDLFRVADI